MPSSCPELAPSSSPRMISIHPCPLHGFGRVKGDKQKLRRDPSTSKVGAEALCITGFFRWCLPPSVVLCWPSCSCKACEMSTSRVLSESDLSCAVVKSPFFFLHYSQVCPVELSWFQLG